LSMRLFVASQRRQKQAIPLVDSTVVGLQFQSMTEFSLRRIPFPQGLLGTRQNGVGLRQSVVDGQCPLRRRSRFGSSVDG
jgi:hypothetical protein